MNEIIEEEPEIGTRLDAPEEPAALDPGPSELDVTPLDRVALLEALLFASGKPVGIDKLAECTELTEAEVLEGLAELEKELGSSRRGLRLDRVAGGARLVSRAEFDYPIRRLLGADGKTKLSMPALETLAIIAYRQPLTAPEVAELRGVNSSSSLRTLLDRKLITTAGRKEVVGTPFLYKTTKEFLVHFGISDPSELPKLEEMDSLYGIETQPAVDGSQVELFPSVPDEVEADTEAEPTRPSPVAAAETAGPAEPAETRAPEDAPAPSEPQEG